MKQVISWRWIVAAVFYLILATPGNAHVAEQGFVLLLPTGAYTIAGTLTVAITVLVLVFVPKNWVSAIFGSVKIASSVELAPLRTAVSLSSLALLIFTLVVGVVGSRDPLTNILPLFIWTVFWMVVLVVQGVLGNVWRWINPWTGLHELLFRPSNPEKIPNHYELPQQIGVWPAIAQFILFSAFMLADIAPDDPFRLAYIVGGYWLLNFLALVLFGDEWLERGECFSCLLSSFSKLSSLRYSTNNIRFGLPGWQLINMPIPHYSLGLFALIILAIGSFDGINETFWWLGLIGINPLEFPGRSAVVTPTLVGLVVSCIALVSIFSVCVWLGKWLVHKYDGHPSAWSFRDTFSIYAMSILPIAFGYHIAHYFTSFLVSGQYVLAALSDPLTRGDDFLGLGIFYVTTGFFNAPDTVKTIWLTQASAVVVGHVVAIMVAHGQALRLFERPRAAFLSQLPLSIFMIAYTILGLWLLASPRGA